MARKQLATSIIPEAITVAVTSGKGGVGKTTTAISLAVAFVNRGHDVIVIDADIDGPNVHLISEMTDLDLGVNKDTLTLQLPRSPFGFRVATPTSVAKVDPGARVAVSDLISMIRFCEPATVIVVDLPPGWTDHHGIVASVLPNLIVTVVAPTVPAISDHNRHIKAWRKAWTAAIGAVKGQDRRRKIELPTEPTFAVVETMARFTGIPDGGGEMITIRRADGLSAEQVAKHVNPLVSIPATATIAEGAATPEIAVIVDLVLGDSEDGDAAVEAALADAVTA